MGRFEHSQTRALELLDEIGDGLRRRVPSKAAQWVEAGAALGAMRAGAKVAGGFVRRNPVLVGAVVVGAGLLWLAARQRARTKPMQPVARLRHHDWQQDDYGV